MKTIFLCRHAQAEHNVTKNYALPDPVLSAFGRHQAKDNIHTPYGLQLVVSSPFRRCLLTTHIALSTCLGQLPLLVCPLFQECANKPCDTGSPLSVLRDQFRELPADWSEMERLEKEASANGNHWYEKVGLYDASPAGLQHRAALARTWLWRRPETVIFVMTHHGWLQQLVGSRPWDNAELNEYALQPRRPLTGEEADLELGNILEFIADPSASTRSVMGKALNEGTKLS